MNQVGFVLQVTCIAIDKYNVTFEINFFWLIKECKDSPLDLIQNVEETALTSNGTENAMYAKFSEETCWMPDVYAWIEVRTRTCGMNTVSWNE